MKSWVGRQILFAVFIAVTILTLSSKGALSKEGLCKNPAEYVHVKMGGHIFALPWKEAFLYLKNGNETLVSNCYKVGDVPIEITMFGFSPHVLNEKNTLLVNKYANPEIARKTGYGFALGVGAVSASNHIKQKIKDTFEQVLENELQHIHHSYTQLPKKGDYYVWEDGVGESIYIAADKGFVTPNGNPVTFKCRPFAGKGGPSHCASSIVWKDNIQFNFEDAQELYVPQSRWREFYYDFLQYMESLEIKPKSLE